MKTGHVFVLGLIILLQTMLSAQQKSPPGWTVNPSQYQYSANITAKLRLNDAPAPAGSNLLAAFVGTEVRGVATPLAFGGDYLYFLTVYTNNASETVTLKAYIASIDKIADVQGSQMIEPNGVYGTVSNPVIYNSYYMSNHPPQLAGIPDQTIETGQQFAQFDLDTYLTELDGDPVTFSYSGNNNLTVSINSTTHVVTVTPNPANWTGIDTMYFRVTDANTAALFSQDTVVFRVRPLDHAPHINTLPNQKVGANTQFQPLNLQSYLVEQDGDSVKWSYEFDNTGANETKPVVTVNPNAFVNSMTMTAEVTAFGRATSGTGNLLVAYSGTAVRGYASSLLFGTKYLYFLTIYGNTTADTISFKYFDSTAKRYVPVDQKIIFTANGSFGTPSVPYQLDAGNILVTLTPQNVAQFKIVDLAWTGTERVRFRVQDLGSLHSYWDTASVSLQRLADRAPVVAGIPDQIIQKGQSFTTFDLDTYLTELDGDAVTWSKSGNSNLTVSIGAGNVVTITSANPNWTGTENIIFRATDLTTNALYGSDTAQFKITPIDHAPVVGGIPDQVTGQTGAFPPLNLRNYLTEQDGDSILWSYTEDIPVPSDPAPTWTVNPAAFEMTMNMTVEVTSLGISPSGNTHQLAAYAGTQLRGVATPLSFNGKWVYFLTVYANGSGERINFKFYDTRAGKILPVKESVTFTANATFGTPSAPYQMRAGLVLFSLNPHNVLNAVITDTTWAGTQSVTVMATDFNTANHYNDTAKVRFIVVAPVSAAAPSHLTATPKNSPGRIELSWTDNSTNETRFVIQRKTGDTTSTSAYVTLDSTAADVESFTDATVADSTRYTYRVFARFASSSPAYSNQTAITSFTSSPELQIRAFIEGLYRTTGDTCIADTVSLMLRTTTTSYALADSLKIKLDNTGRATCYFPKANKTSQYYLVVMHRNALETWSALPVSFAGGKLAYDFTTDSAKAYGKNLVKKGTRWCLLSGDTNQDGIIDYTDMSAIDNDNFFIRAGYRSTDLDGNYFVDMSDLFIADNNSSRYAKINNPLHSSKIVGD